MVELRPPRSALCLTVSVALMLATTGGCDKLRGGDDGSENDSPPEDELTKAEKAEKEAEDAAKKKAEDAAKQEENEEAADAKQAEADGERKSEEEAEKLAEEEAKKPISLSEVSIADQSGMFGGNGAMRVTAKAKLQHKIDQGTYVHAKAVCKRGEEFLADAAIISADYQKPLQQYELGQSADIQGMLFGQGVDSAMSPCQLQFSLAGSSGGVSIPLETVCYDGTEAKSGECDPPIVAPAMSGASSPLEVTSLTVAENSAYGSSGALQSTYVIKVNEPQDTSTQLTIKAACQVGDKKFVDMGSANFMAGPFRYESGESIARAASLFWNPAFGFADSPRLCDVEVDSWAPKAGSYGEMENTLLEHACYRDGKVTVGPCDPAASFPPPPAPVDKDSLSIDNIVMQIVEPYGSKGDRFQLQLQADATVNKPVDQSAGLNAKVTCKVGKTARVETAYLYGTELYYLGPGETTRMSTNAFTSNAMEKRPTTCEADFTAGRRFSPTGEEGTSLGKWCLRKDKLKKGKC